MAFGINRKELQQWKRKINQGEIAFLTHYWLDERFPGYKTVTKVGCSDLQKLKDWGKLYGLKSEWLHIRQDGYSHFDLIGSKQKEVLTKENLEEHLDRFNFNLLSRK